MSLDKRSAFDSRVRARCRGPTKTATKKLQKARHVSQLNLDNCCV
eukprot:UN03600